jgi:hypothetical protein
MLKAALLISTIVIGSSLSGFGQQAERNRPVRERPTTEASTPRPPVGVSRPAPAPRVYSRGTSIQPTPGGGGLPSIPVQTYAHGVIIRNADWYRFNSFLDRLMFQYRFLPGYEYQWRYAQGDSPLTPELLDLALREPASASSSLALLGDDLSRLIDRYQEGAIGSEDFSARLKETTRAIRSLAKKIRRDQFLSYLDLRADTKVPSYSSPDNLDELRALSRELAETARRIETGIHDFREKEMSRVVSVNDLTDDSLDSLARRVDRMARVIERSGARL